jgi:GNAT superfamily N-acetyltransferase
VVVDFERQGPVTYEWRGAFQSSEIEALHAECFDHPPAERCDRWRHLRRHSLGWVCARASNQLIGFVNVAWDGAAHAFLLDTMVTASARRRGIGAQLVAEAVVRTRAAGCEWLHVDFDDGFRPFYIDACGFHPTQAGLIRL